jgi:hypothetical protein
MWNITDYRLVFYSKALNGIVVTEAEYVKLLRTMTREDFETHLSVPVDASMHKDVKAVIELDSKPIKRIKAS